MRVRALCLPLLLTEAALEKLDFVTAERAFVKMGDYSGVQLVKRLNQLGDKAIQRAVLLIQEGDRRKLARAALISYRSETPGMMRHRFLDTDEGAQRRKLADDLRKEGRLIDHASLLEIFDAVIAATREQYEEGDK